MLFNGRMMNVGLIRFVFEKCTTSFSELLPFAKIIFALKKRFENWTRTSHIADTLMACFMYRVYCIVLGHEYSCTADVIVPNELFSNVTLNVFIFPWF